MNKYTITVELTIGNFYTLIAEDKEDAISQAKVALVDFVKDLRASNLIAEIKVIDARAFDI